MSYGRRESVLEIKDLEKNFYTNKKKKTAVNELSFSLGKGEILGVIGESGSGKSTLLRLISKQVKRDSGRIFFLGRDIDSYGKEIYSSMQMVFQDPRGSFDPKFTVGEAITEMRNNLDVESPFTQAELLAQVGLKSEYLERYPWELSGGECQRLAIAKAFYPLPKLILCDEITSSLDVSAQAKVIDVLIGLVKNYRVSVVFVSHNIALVSTFCDRIMIMKDGNLIEEGITEKVLSKPSEKYTRDLIEAQKLFRKGKYV